MKRLVTLIVVVTFCFSMAGIAGAEIGKTQQSPALGSNVPKPAPIFACPAGWHVKGGSWTAASITTCVPDTPKPIKCPSGTQYVDNLEKGCFVGCTPIIK